ncbi:methionine aminopeptidase 1D, mitochondrial-like [Diadema antillarum]|uniref:methionine aminopeptidase 1D, mitochondrial-like n=1 Tax=Diadema antillarum TaxID=105358 RepID=UPI003A87B2E8
MIHPVLAIMLGGKGASSLLCRGCLKKAVTAQLCQQRGVFNIFQKWRKGEEPAIPTNYSVVKPGKVSPMKTVPDGIEMPEYAHSGIPNRPPARDVFILDRGAIDCMREAGQLARKLLDLTAAEIQVGVTTDHLDEVIHQACIDHKAYPSTLNYNCFPKSVCTSVNNVMVHGIPDDRPLEDGDIINMDFTVYLNGFHADLSETYLVGDVDDAGKHLVKYARICRDEAIKVCGPEYPISNIGNTITEIAQRADLYVSPSFVGHGINTFFHCKPNIWHYANAYAELMMAGMTFTIEPVLLERMDKPSIGDDQWTVSAVNHTRSAQFEHTILITSSGFEVLTAGEGEDFSAMTDAPEADNVSQWASDADVRNEEDWTFEKKT